MSLREKLLQPIASDDQMPLVADNQPVAFKLSEKFGYARTRRAHQIGEILMSWGDREAGAAPLLYPEIFA